MTASASRTILLVDDDAAYLARTRRGLEAAGYSVTDAASAGEAQSLVEDGFVPDLAVVDLVMEYADSGFTLAYHLRKRLPELPIIIVTSVRSETGIIFDLSAEDARAWIHADVILDKPLRFEQLLREVHRFLRA